MTKDDFHKSSSNNSQSGTSGDGAGTSRVVPLKPQLQGPRPPVPRPPMPKPPFGMQHVATSVKVLPALVNKTKTTEPLKPEMTKDDE
jgi:hypothetical protein